jgi:Spy/CpxP family protein refolding chaperone
MRTNIKLAFLSVLAVTFTVTAAWAEEQNYQPPQPMQEWLSETQQQGTIQPGTTINIGNWQQYKQFMPYGL